MRFISLGIDLGTSGIRMAVVQANKILAEFSSAMPTPEKLAGQSQQNPIHWQTALERCFAQLQQAGWCAKIDGIICDATSSTLLLVNPNGEPASPALMYDDKRAQTYADRFAQELPKTSGAQGATSSLAKACWLAEHYGTDHLKLCHQIDWLNAQLCGQATATDENNLLKLGYDSINQAWPTTVQQILPFPLPQVVAAGTLLGHVGTALKTRWGFRSDCQVFAGTTDSIAAFLAAGATDIGDAVTALGSTLAIKLLSDRPIFAAEHGVYSHKLGDKWLVGGASNAGGAVLLHYFSLEQLADLIPHINIHHPTGLDCYPLIHAGERFPIANPNLSPRIPATSDKALLLQALIEGLVKVENQAYEKLSELGAPKVKRIFGVGGGSRNQAWSDLRAQQLPAKLAQPVSQSAAYGVTRLINP